MAQKQSILGRIGQLARANINALLDRAEDPQKMLDQLVRDYTNSISEAEDAIAVTIGNLRLAEADHAEDLKEERTGAARLSQPPTVPSTSVAPATMRTHRSLTTLRRLLSPSRSLPSPKLSPPSR